MHLPFDPGDRGISRSLKNIEKRKWKVSEQILQKCLLQLHFELFLFAEEYHLIFELVDLYFELLLC